MEHDPHSQTADIMMVLSSVLEPRYAVGWFVVIDESFHLWVIDPNLAYDFLVNDQVMVGLHIANSDVGKRAVMVDVMVYANSTRKRASIPRERAQ